MNVNHVCKECQGRKRLLYRDRVLEDDYDITDEFLTREQDCWACLGRGAICSKCGGSGYVRAWTPFGTVCNKCNSCDGDGFCPPDSYEQIEDLKKMLADTQKIEINNS